MTPSFYIPTASFIGRVLCLVFFLAIGTAATAQSPSAALPQERAWFNQRGPVDSGAHERALAGLSNHLDTLAITTQTLATSLKEVEKTGYVNQGRLDTLSGQLQTLQHQIQSVRAPNRPDVEPPAPATSNLKSLEAAISHLEQEIESLKTLSKAKATPSAQEPTSASPSNISTNKTELQPSPPQTDTNAAATAVSPEFRTSVNIAWTLLCGFLIMLMQAGFALVETGFVRKKNAAHTMMMNFLVYALAMLGYWSFGFAFHMGGLGTGLPPDAPQHTLGTEVFPTLNSKLSIWGVDLLGLKGFFLADPALHTGGILTLFLFFMLFMDTAATIPTGTLAERWRLLPFSLFAFSIGAVIYPVYACWIWGGGWLSDLGKSCGLGNGAVDFAGSSAVHLCGGTIAYVSAKFMGGRHRRYTQTGKLLAFPKHNVPMGILGTLILAFGWFGFNSGSTMEVNSRVANIAVNTMLASAAGAVTMLVVTKLLWGRPTVSYLCNGMLAGLVSITASCAYVSPNAAVLIGIFGALVFFVSTAVLEGNWVPVRVDDPVGAVSVHGASGIWGMIALGLFANGTYGAKLNGVDGPVTGLFYSGSASQLWAQLVAVVACILITALLTTGCYFLTGLVARGSHRANDLDQDRGLDLTELGIGDAYSPEAFPAEPDPEARGA